MEGLWKMPFAIGSTCNFQSLIVNSSTSKSELIAYRLIFGVKLLQSI